MNSKKKLSSFKSLLKNFESTNFVKNENILLRYNLKSIKPLSSISSFNDNFTS